MKTYKCRCTKRTMKWIKINADCPESAACYYAERCHLQGGDVVMVMGEGRFEMYEETVYSATKQG